MNSISFLISFLAASVMLPDSAALADPKPDTAATAYLGAVRLLRAQAAAEYVLESFIEHALRLDGCKAASKRSTTGSQGPAE